MAMPLHVWVSLSLLFAVGVDARRLVQHASSEAFPDVSWHEKLRPSWRSGKVWFLHGGQPARLADYYEHGFAPSERNLTKYNAENENKCVEWTANAACGRVDGCSWKPKPGGKTVVNKGATSSLFYTSTRGEECRRNVGKIGPGYYFTVYHSKKWTDGGDSATSARDEFWLQRLMFLNSLLKCPVGVVLEPSKAAPPKMGLITTTDVWYDDWYDGNDLIRQSCMQSYDGLFIIRDSTDKVASYTKAPRARECDEARNLLERQSAPTDPCVEVPWDQFKYLVFMECIAEMTLYDPLKHASFAGFVQNGKPHSKLRKDELLVANSTVQPDAGSIRTWLTKHATTARRLAR